MGLNRKLPHVGNAGMGLNRKLPHVGNAGRGAYIRDTMQALCDRLRNVRVCCGDWTRVCGPSPTTYNGLTAVLLDPPYGAEGQLGGIYGAGHEGVAEAARRWALDHGDDPLMRIALCGYADEHPMPDTWQCVAWKANGGYSNRAGNQNAHRERIWFSPHCVVPEQEHGGLFANGS